MNPLLKLIEHGQSYWIDNLTRVMIQSGELKRRVTEEGLRGMTSNPTILNKAISKSRDYDDQIEKAVAARRSVRETYEDLITTDIRNACDVLRPVYDQTEGADGFVSLEVSPHLEHNTEDSIREARQLFKMVDRLNLFIKIPGTPAGVPAIEKLLFEGININITLLFSIESYEAVAQAYIRALERRAEAGRSVRDVASVASFFLSRIDTLVDQLLHHIRPEATSIPASDTKRLLGKAAIANAKLAYQSFKRILQGDRWKALERKGARPQRMLWASTSTKNPDYRDLMYVEPLIGPYTVNTMPDETIAAFADHGIVKDTVEEGIDEAKRVMEDLKKIGIDFRQVTEQLLNEGVQKFIEPYDALMKTLSTKQQVYMNRTQAKWLEDMAHQLRAR